jgi:hypothetical protein
MWDIFSPSIIEGDGVGMGGDVTIVLHDWDLRHTFQEIQIGVSFVIFKISYYRSSQAEILEFYLTRPESHLAGPSLARSLSSNMLPVPHLSPTFFYSSPNEARSI